MSGRANLHGSILTPRDDLREKAHLRRALSCMSQRHHAAAVPDRSRTTVDLGGVWASELPSGARQGVGTTATVLAATDRLTRSSRGPTRDLERRTDPPPGCRRATLTRARRNGPASTTAATS